MKILVFSDSHSSVAGLVKMAEIEKPDAVICAGDYARDAEELSFVKNNLDYFIVKGNCDMFDHRFKDILEFKIGGFEFYLTHGHLHGVKGSLEKLKKETKKLNKNIVIFGHTHIPFYELQNGVYYFNPGAARDGNYGILFLENNKVRFEQKRL